MFLWKTLLLILVAILGAEGKKAVVELGKVLGDNPDISVLIEGHTDDDGFPVQDQLPITGTYQLKELQRLLLY
jgi:ribosomal protein S6E (S10)